VLEPRGQVIDNESNPEFKEAKSQSLSGNNAKSYAGFRIEGFLLLQINVLDVCDGMAQE